MDKVRTVKIYVGAQHFTCVSKKCDICRVRFECLTSDEVHLERDEVHHDGFPRVETWMVERYLFGKENE